jgi:predicted phage terminase large subunit-like protein
MSIDQRGLLALHREQFTLFAAKAFTTINPGAELVPSKAFLAICHAMDRVVKGDIKRLLVTVPPRSAKSIIGSVALPAYILGRDPTRRIVCASYSIELATKHARDSRALMQDPFYRRLFAGTVIRKSTETEIETAHYGSRFATSVGGTLTGRGGNLIVIDDPMKPDEAMSRVARQRAWDWFTGTVGSRLDDKSKDAMIVIMQRLHVEDLAGRLLDHGGWEHLNLPAIADTRQTVPLGRGKVWKRHPGDVLDPVREPLEVLEQLRRDLGSANFAAQYLQQPTPEEGGHVRWSWFKTYDKTPSRGATDWMVMSWDTAMKGSELNDYSVGIRALVKPNQDVYILDVIRERLDFPTLRQRIIAEARLARTTVSLIEDAGSGTSLLQDLHGKISTIPWRPYGEKAVRFQAVTPMIEGGKLYLPAAAPWLEAFKREILSFPSNGHDDQVDALSQLLNWVHARLSQVPLQGRYTTR